MTLRLVPFTLAAMVAYACVDAPQDEVSLELVASGMEVDELGLGDGLSLSLSRADLAFGPLYLCPGTQAGELCDTARLEWTQSAVVDVLDSEPQSLGRLLGVTGPIRSYMFDYGISSLLTQERPQILDAAEQLDGASLVLSGEAILDGTAVPFSVGVVVEQSEDTESGVPVVRKSTTERFDFEVTVDSRRFTVAFRPESWFSSVSREHFDDAINPDDCEIGVDESCEEIEFDPDSSLARVIGQALSAGRRPEFSLN